MKLVKQWKLRELSSEWMQTRRLFSIVFRDVALKVDAAFEMHLDRPEVAINHFHSSEKKSRHDT